MGFKERLKAYGLLNILTSTDIKIAAIVTLGLAGLSYFGYLAIQTTKFVNILIPTTASVLGLLLVALSLYVAIAGRKFAIKLMPDRETYDRFIFLLEYTFYLLIASIATGVLYTTMQVPEYVFYLYTFLTVYAFISLLQFTSLIINLMGRERIRQLFEERKDKTDDKLVEKHTE